MIYALVLCYVLNFIALFVACFTRFERERKHKEDRKSVLGRQYAMLGWAYAAQQPDSKDPIKARKHACEGFIIADTAADGRRDFTDKQVAIYVDAGRKP